MKMKYNRKDLMSPIDFNRHMVRLSKELAHAEDAAYLEFFESHSKECEVAFFQFEMIVHLEDNNVSYSVSFKCKVCDKISKITPICK
jgi:hypothetical protein